MLKLPEKLAEPRVRRRGQRSDDVKWPAALGCAHPFPAGLQAKMDHLPDRVAHRHLVLDRGEAAVEVQGLFTASLEDLRSTSEGVLPGLFG